MRNRFYLPSGLRSFCFALAQFGQTRTNTNTRTHSREKESGYRTPRASARAHVCARGAERKLQHNDKVWEHNGPSSAQTEARTSLAPKGQQASPSFHSVPLLIIVQHYNDYSDGLYFANVGAIRKYQRNMKSQPGPEGRAEGRIGTLVFRVNLFDVRFPRPCPKALDRTSGSSGSAGQVPAQRLSPCVQTRTNHQRRRRECAQRHNVERIARPLPNQVRYVNSV